MKYSERVNNGRLDSIQQTVGGSPVCCIYSGYMPASCDKPPAGKLLVTMKLPAHWLKTAEKCKVTSTGPWSGEAVAGGEATFFRIETKEGCDLQGTVGGRNSNAELTLLTKTAEIVSGQLVTVESFSIASGNR
jgi:hypothetical protein